MDGMNREKWKSMTPQQKREHIWEYYKGYFIAAAIVLAVGAWFINYELNRVDPQMNVILADMAEPLENDRVFHPFLEEYGYEVYDKAVEMNQNLRFFLDTEDADSVIANGNAYDALFGMASTGKQEILFAQPKVYASCVVDGAMMDLSTVLPAEMLEKYQDRFLFNKDEETGESYPCGVNVEGNPWMEQVQKNYKGYVGIFNRTDDRDKAVSFIIYFLKQFDKAEGA